MRIIQHYVLLAVWLLSLALLLWLRLGRKKKPAPEATRTWYILLLLAVACLALSEAAAVFGEAGTLAWASSVSVPLKWAGALLIIGGYALFARRAPGS